MKQVQYSHLLKAVVLAVSGILIAFFPSVISSLFYIIGLLVLIGGIVSLLGSVLGKNSSTGLSSGIVTILAGVGIMILPRFVAVQVPVIAGIVIGVMGLVRILRGIDSSLPQKQRTTYIIMGIVMLLIASFLTFHPFSAGRIARKIIGIAMLVFAALYFYAAYAVKKHGAASAAEIIDVDNFTVK